VNIVLHFLAEVSCALLYDFKIVFLMCCFNAFCRVLLVLLFLSVMLM